MIDLILFISVLGIFYLGFWLGAKYRTIGNMLERLKAAFSSSTPSE